MEKQHAEIPKTTAERSFSVKVCELMAALSELPAEAEVEFVKVMTLSEFCQLEVVDDVDGRDANLISASIKEVEPFDKDHVSLYP